MNYDYWMKEISGPAIKIAQGFLQEKKRANDLRALELEFRVEKVFAEAEDHSVSFEFFEGFRERIRQCGK